MASAYLKIYITESIRYLAGFQLIYNRYHVKARKLRVNKPESPTVLKYISVIFYLISIGNLMGNPCIKDVVVMLKISMSVSQWCPLGELTDLKRKKCSYNRYQGLLSTPN